MQAANRAKHEWEEAFKESEIDRQNLAREIELHRSIIHQLRGENEELAELKQNPPPAIEQNPAPTIELPEPADLLNRLKARRKKSKADLADVEAILELLEGGDG
ncbi:flagellar alpha dynein [Microcoleus sp. B3-A4]|uniref:flagellar alpha dynein n=1 Tax=Microcoleus sp. B3-A4 TaxID=2818653 RepID=UPI002FD7406A